MFTEIEKLVKKKGYVAQTECAVYTVEVDKWSLWIHIQRLALTFRLLAFTLRASVRIQLVLELLVIVMQSYVFF